MPGSDDERPLRDPSGSTARAVGTLTLARPGKRNAQNPLMWDELGRLGDGIVGERPPMPRGHGGGLGVLGRTPTLAEGMTPARRSRGPA